jgi:hypothetical protein
VNPTVYVFAWGGIRFGGARKGHRCRVVLRLPFNSALVEWETGGRDVISRNALRRAKP